MSMISVRDGYAKVGVDDYYKKHGSNYRNPHEHIIKELLLIAIQKGITGKKILDLCCGSGEVTMMLPGYEVTGLDPYTSAAYKSRTGKNLLELSFIDISEGELSGEYDSIICSFALHLCPKSLLPLLLWRLGDISSTLIILTPHKRPDCDNISGWFLVEEIMINRVRMRIYLR